MRSLCSSTEFLKNKFILDLEDAEEEHSGKNEIPLRSHFLQIRDVLEAKDITASTPIRLKNCLYNVISALEDCVVLSEKRESRQKKDGPMHGYTGGALAFMKNQKVVDANKEKVKGYG
ncbi:uncharacterized protein LOC104878926 [Vitis vinifera]|uniref:uncharacterized protein LOC104878926 n=1 Tax=Vitis vinifera TaxID=29760 RepID=UPI00053F82ED|nr:uncharacterized protein LOC104878926 [Vitis vinifera]|eukprot:XP_010648191.1 PREDICTED: uncharacterized protein LOC104878926 [Vitis vinifera]